MLSELRHLLEQYPEAALIIAGGVAASLAAIAVIRALFSCWETDQRAKPTSDAQPAQPTMIININGGNVATTETSQSSTSAKTVSS